MWLAEGLQASGRPCLLPSGYAVSWLLMVLSGNLGSYGRDLEMGLEGLTVLSSGHIRG